jgi:hypothetical protein
LAITILIKIPIKRVCDWQCDKIREISTNKGSLASILRRLARLLWAPLRDLTEGIKKIMNLYQGTMIIDIFVRKLRINSLRKNMINTFLDSSKLFHGIQQTIWLTTNERVLIISLITLVEKKGTLFIKQIN